MPDRIRLTLPSSPQYVSVARLAAGEAADRAGLDHDAAEDVRLATSEACTNAVRHAGDARTIEVEFGPGDGEMSVAVSWTRSGAQPADHLDQVELDEEELGLMLIHDLTDEVVTQTALAGRSTIRFVRRAES